MSLSMKRRVILAKIEATPGTDPTPSGAANAIEVRNLDITPLAGDMSVRDQVRSTMGNFSQIPANTHVLATFDVFLAGAGAAGDAPAYGPLLRACGLAETITADTKVEYTPVSTGFESVTIYINVDGVRHKLTWSMGTFQIMFDAQQRPFLRFNFTGLWNAVADASLPTPDYSGFQNPLVVNEANTTTFTVHGYAAVMQSFGYTHGNQVEPRLLVNEERVIITDRQPSGDMLINAVLVATKDFFGIAKAGTTGALAIVHGTAAGNIVKVDMPALQFGQLAYENSQNIAMLRAPYVALPSSGDDEFKLTVQ